MTSFALTPSPFPLRAVLLLITSAVLLALWLFPPLYVAAALGGIAVAVAALRLPWMGFGLLAFAVPWGSGVSVTIAGFPVSPTDGAVALIAAVWIVAAVEARQNPFGGAIWIPYVVIFVLAISLSAVAAADWHASLREIVKWIEMGAVYCAAMHLLRDRVTIMTVIAAVVASGLSQALLGYVQFGWHLGPAAFASQHLFLRAYGTFDQPNPYAGYLNMILPIGLGFALLGPRRLRRWGWMAAVLLLGAVLVSESRGALLAGLVASSAVAACASRAAWRSVWAGVFVLLVAAWLASLGLVPTSPADRFLTAVGLGNVTFGSVNDANFSAVERAAHWLAGVRMFAAHPLLGVGIGNYSAAYPQYHPRGWYASLGHAHNYYINIAAEAGIMGLATYLLLIGSALWYSFVSVRLAREHVNRAIALGVAGALIATSAHNIFDVLYVHGTAALLGLLIALSQCGVRHDRRSSHARDTR